MKKVVVIEPMGKPRMTRRDKWAGRECVKRYWAFKDTLKLVVGKPPPCSVLSWTAYFTMPDSWSAKKRKLMVGKPHQVKPDRDNVDKAILDALFDNDATIYSGTLVKLWDDGKGARIELEIE